MWNQRRVALAIVAGLSLLTAGFAVVSSLFAGSDEEAAVRETVAKALSSRQIPACSELFTDHWRQTYPSQTSRPGSCSAKGHSDPLAEGRATVGAVDVSGPTATAVVDFSTNPAGYRSLTLGLEKQSDWKIDSLASIQIDKSRFIDHQQRKFAGPEITPAGKRYFRCELGWIRRNVSTRELEASVTVGRGDYYLGSFHRCADAFRAEIIRVMARRALPRLSQRRCVAGALGDLLTTADLSSLYQQSAAGSGSPAAVTGKLHTAVAICTQPSHGGRSVVVKPPSPD